MENINTNRVIITLGNSSRCLDLSYLNRDKLLEKYSFLEGVVVTDGLKSVVRRIAGSREELNRVIIILIFDENNNLVAGESISEREKIKSTVDKCLDFNTAEGYWFMVTSIRNSEINLLEEEEQLLLY